MFSVILIAFFQLSAYPQPLRSGCAPEDPEVASIGADDRLQVETALAGLQAETCYKVVLEQNGKRLTGYVLGESLPAIAAFVRAREQASKEAAEAAARAELARAAKGAAPPPAAPTTLELFENFSGRDIHGKLVSLSALRARVIVVSFWLPNNRRSTAQLTSLMPLYGQFHTSGLSAVGISMDPNPAHILESLDDITLGWPQITDRNGLAARYNVDPRVGKTFVLDATHHIVASGQMGPELEKAIRKLLQ